jgi:hypothetical protein
MHTFAKRLLITHDLLADPALEIIRPCQRSEALRVCGQGNLQVSNMMPPQPRQGAGQGIGLWLVVVSPHVKQIHAVLAKRSSGPTISSGRPRRLISSSSFMSQMSSCPVGSCNNPLAASLSWHIRAGPNAAGSEGIGQTLIPSRDRPIPPFCDRLRMGLPLPRRSLPRTASTNGPGS